MSRSSGQLFESGLIDGGGTQLFFLLSKVYPNTLKLGCSHPSPLLDDPRLHAQSYCTLSG